MTHQSTGTVRRFTAMDSSPPSTFPISGWFNARRFTSTLDNSPPSLFNFKYQNGACLVVQSGQTMTLKGGTSALTAKLTLNNPSIYTY